VQAFRHFGDVFTVAGRLVGTLCCLLGDVADVDDIVAVSQQFFFAVAVEFDELLIDAGDGAFEIRGGNDAAIFLEKVLYMSNGKVFFMLLLS
jgi:hypothetical protein